MTDMAALIFGSQETLLDSALTLDDAMIAPGQRICIQVQSAKGEWPPLPRCVTGPRHRQQQQHQRQPQQQQQQQQSNNSTNNQRTPAGIWHTGSFLNERAASEGRRRRAREAGSAVCSAAVGAVVTRTPLRWPRSTQPLSTAQVCWS